MHLRSTLIASTNFCPTIVNGHCNDSTQLRNCPSAAFCRSLTAPPVCNQQSTANTRKRQTRTICASAALATYDLLTAKTRSSTWLEPCVRAIVRNLDTAPFLLVVESISREQYYTVHVDEAIFGLPEVWASTFDQVSQSSPQATILVHRVESLEDTCLINKSKKQSGQLPSRQADRSSQPDMDHLVAGKLGDCCENALHDLAEHESLSSSQQGSEQDVRMFGLAVQSQFHQDANGCYVLKTSTSREAGGCHCTHFSLTKVCKGISLPLQLHESWLVNTSQ